VFRNEEERLMHLRRNRGTPTRPRRRCRPHLAGLVGALALTLAVAACAGGNKTGGVASLNGADKPTATTSAGGSKDFKQAALAFARCMRQHGIDLPDPQFNGNGITQELTARRGSNGPDSPKFKAAQQACQKYLPNGGVAPKPNPQQQQQLLQFARCMRQHGIDLPDPGASGGIEVKGGPNTVNPDDPKFKAAQQACQQYLPNNGKGGTLISSGGGGK
jgi:hypothetical protein